MTRACPTTEEMFLLLDGELTENRAAGVREHVEACARCRDELDATRQLVRDVRTRVEPSPGALERVLARLDEQPRAPRRTRAALVAGLAAALAVAAAVALGPLVRAGREAPSGLVARGVAGSRSLARDVGITVYRHTSRLEPLTPNDVVTPETAYAVAFRNIGAGGAAHLMVFAQDAARELHWIDPVWIDAAQNPASVALPHAEQEVVPRSSVVLEPPVSGELHVFVLVTSHVMHVSDLEALAGEPIDASALRARWPDAIVDETVVRVGTDAGGVRP